MSRGLALTGDLSSAAVWAAGLLGALGLALLLAEVWRARRPGRSKQRGLVAVSGLVALAALLLAVLRPVRVQAQGSSVGPRVVLLVDSSRSVDLPGDGSATRRRAIGKALGRLTRHLRAARLQAFVFGAGPARPWADAGTSVDVASGRFDAVPQQGSDLSAALQSVARSSEELPRAIVVLSDGRLDRPGAERVALELGAAMGQLRVPVHTVSAAREVPRDAAVRSVHMAGAAVAHQPLQVTVEVACTGGLPCAAVPVTARELRPDGPPIVRATASAQVHSGKASVDLELVLDQAGTRIVEIAIDAPAGDAIAANDRRLLPVEVTRDRVRLLHLAGRPTYDVRSLRLWLKSDAALDVVAFFILRTPGVDHTNAGLDELALIPFPVDELFTVHLPSFDAVILQDFDAKRHDLLGHLRALASYVRGGGGLIMVGGETGFVTGGYAGTPLASVLPVSMEGIDRQAAVDYASFVPELTDAGRMAPVLQPVRSLLGDQLPEMPGVNIVGPARPDATVLWVHPWLTTPGGDPMPVLALGEYGNGRSIALGLDGSHRLLFSRFAVDMAGRAHGAFWDALLGWLMRDPRFEPAVVDLPNGCIAGQPVTLVLRPRLWPGAHSKDARAALRVTHMGDGDTVEELDVEVPAGDEPVRVELPALPAGGYSAEVHLVEQGQSAPSRYEFACEMGGQEWADPRPDPERLADIAEATGGVAVDGESTEEIPVPEAAVVVTQRRVRPLAPPWGWSLFAALCLSAHWLIRRRAGLS